MQVNTSLSYRITVIYFSDGTLLSLINFLKVTTHGHLLALDELEQVKRVIQMRVESCLLHEFETELDFTSKIR